MLMRNFLRSRRAWKQFLKTNLFKVQRRRLFDLIGIPDKPAVTMAEVHKEIMKRLGLEHGWQPVQKSREHLKKYEPKFEDLPPRSMRDSLTSAIIPLCTDKILQEKYVSTTGHIRLGRLLEDMDAFAVWVVHNYVLVPNLPEEVPLPYTFVTVVVDKVDFIVPLPDFNRDILLCGHVSWVGRSSLEIVVQLSQINDTDEKLITKAVFLMAARNATNSRALAVNPLVPADDVEEKIFSGGGERNHRRKIIQDTSIFKVEPNDYEESLIYDLFKRTTDANSMELNKRVIPDGCRWMSDSYAISTVASFPEHRNSQNTVFGGFLMRSALETSWVAANIYCKSNPDIKHLCDISFEQPVSMNSILKMIAYVVYTDANYLTIMTVIDILDRLSGMQLTSNVFYIVFKADDFVPEVLPRSYQENMWYIQGRRKFKYSLGLE